MPEDVNFAWKPAVPSRRATMTSSQAVAAGWPHDTSGRPDHPGLTPAAGVSTFPQFHESANDVGPGSAPRPAARPPSIARFNNPRPSSPSVLPEDFQATPPSEKERVTAFCGACQHFETHPLGGGGECHKGHDPQERADAGSCPDRLPSAVSGGPLFDMSE